MSGYFTRNNGDVFEGEFPCAEQGGIEQGLFCKNDADGVKAAAIYNDGTKGVFSAQITTPFADGDTLAVDAVVYTLAAAEDVAAKKFAGLTAANQATSLAKMVKADNFTVAASTDKLVFTQVL